MSLQCRSNATAGTASRRGTTISSVIGQDIAYDRAQPHQSVGGRHIRLRNGCCRGRRRCALPALAAVCRLLHTDHRQRHPAASVARPAISSALTRTSALPTRSPGGASLCGSAPAASAPATSPRKTPSAETNTWRHHRSSISGRIAGGVRYQRAGFQRLRHFIDTDTEGATVVDENALRVSAGFGITRQSPSDPSRWTSRCQSARRTMTARNSSGLPQERDSDELTNPN